MISPQDIVERTLELSQSDGCVVIVDEESSANLRWANNSLTTDGVTGGRRLTVVATVGAGTAASAGVVSVRGAVDDMLADLVGSAEQAARDAEPAEDAQPLVIRDETSPSWAAPVAATSVDVFSAVAPALGEAFAAARAHDQLLFGYAEHTVQSTFLGSSTGARLRTDRPAGHVELTGKSADQQRSSWTSASSADFADVTVAGLYDQIDQRLRWARRRVDLPPGRYETLLPPPAVADLMNYVYWSAGARDTAEGQTVFSALGGATRVGERLTEVPLTLRGDPGAPGLECRPFVLAHASDGIVSVFDNGLPLQPTAWVDRGVLRALVQTRHSAASTGLPLTPHIDNLIVEGAGGASGLDELMHRTPRGLLLTCLWYIREVDPQTLLLTGLTRDGVYLVEDGEVVGAVNNFRFNESPVDLLGRVLGFSRTEATRAREWGNAFSRTAMPALRVADFNMSSVSRAI
jgi:predicted Zn-dependent protease